MTINAKKLFEKVYAERKEKINKLEKDIDKFLIETAVAPRERMCYDLGVIDMYTSEALARLYDDSGWEVEIHKKKGKESPTIFTFYAG